MLRTTIVMVSLTMVLGCHDSAPDPGSSDAVGTDGTSGTTGTGGTSGTTGVDGTTGAACTPNTTTCNQNVFVECSAGGVGLSFVCDGGCNTEGECLAAETVCTPNEQSCEGNQVVECNASGTTAETVEKCDFGCDTGTATCKAPACAVGQTRCSPDSPDVVEVCKSDQTGWNDSAFTCPLGCDSGSCTVGLCTAGETRCGGAGVETCGGLGLTYSLTEACENGCIGDPGSAECAACPAAGVRCDGGVPQTCTDPAAGWQDGPACAVGTTCSEGQCAAAVVLPDMAPDIYLALVKAFVDCWVNNTAGLCTAIDASAYPSPITLNEIKAWFCAGAGDAAFIAQFEDQDEYFLASDVLGACASSDPTNEQDVTFNILSIAGGESGTTCIGFSAETTFSSPNGREVIVDLCAAF